jgi:biopolymer transport protein ExbB/TolQ
MVAGIEQVLFNIAQALRIPVIILALLALAVILVEMGSVTVELVRRRRRRIDRMEAAVAKARTFMAGGWIEQAIVSLRPVTWSNRMERTMEQLVPMIPTKRSEDRISKTLADFDYESLRRLERTRVLVRAGPALGLMGTLIPLAPGLAALAEGDVATLTLNLRLAFSITIVGLLIGAIAFTISLIRDRVYGQDLSDLEYMVAMIDPGGETITETDLVRALGKARRRPGRHSLPDEDLDVDEHPGSRPPVGPAHPTQVIPAASDTPGVRAGESPSAQAAGPAHVETAPAGRRGGGPGQPEDTRDYLTELTAGLGTWGEEDANGDPAKRASGSPPGDGNSAKDTTSGRGPTRAADEEERT